MATLSISMVQKIAVEVEGETESAVRQSLHHGKLREMGKRARGFIIPTYLLTRAVIDEKRRRCKCCVVLSLEIIADFAQIFPFCIMEP